MLKTRSQRINERRVELAPNAVRKLTAVLLAPALLMCPAICFAQGAGSDWSRCTNGSPFIAVASCTKLLNRPDINQKQRAEIYYQRGLKYLDGGLRKEALADYTSAINADGQFVLAYVNRSAAHQQQGELDEAIQDASKAIELAPTMPAAYLNRGWAYQAKGDFDRAIDDATQALGLEPRFALAYTNRGWANLNDGFIDRAIADYSRSTELDASNAKAFQQFGFLLFNKGDFKQAAEAFSKSLQVNYESYAALFKYIAEFRGSPDARSDLKLPNVTPDAIRWPYPVFQLFKGERSVDELSSAAKEPGEKCEASFYSGEYYIQRREWQKGEAALQQATLQCPKDYHEYEAAVVELDRVRQIISGSNPLPTEVRYLSDVPSSIYRWLEDQQRKKENGGCKKTDITELKEVGESLPRRNNWEDPNALMVEAGIDKIVLPTRCEDIATYFIANLRAKEIRSGAVLSAKLDLAPIALGTILNCAVTAQAQSINGDRIVVLNRPLFPFLYAMSLTIVRTIVIQHSGQGLSYSFSAEDFERVIRSNPGIVDDFVALAVAFAKGRALPDLKFANEDEGDIVALQLASMEYFIVSHEFGHVVLRHVDAHLADPAVSSACDRSLPTTAAEWVRRDDLGDSWIRELQADQFGDRLAPEARSGVESSIPLFRALMGYAPALYFELADILEDINLCGSNGEGSGRKITEDDQLRIQQEVVQGLKSAKARNDLKIDVSDATSKLLGCRQAEYPPAWLRGRLSSGRADSIFVPPFSGPTQEVQLAKALVANAKRLMDVAANEIRRRLAE